MQVNKKTLLIVASGLVVTVTGLIGLSSFDDAVPSTNTELVEAEINPAPETLFDIPVNNYSVEEAVVGNNEFLSTILQRYQIDLATISRLAEKSKDVYDVRRISAGRPYTVFKDAHGKADYLIYQPNRIEYVTYDLTGETSVSVAKKPVTSSIRTVAGVINSSLYQTLDEQGVNPDMATILSEIYGWTVNFYSIQKGDYFKIIYENQEVDGETVGTGKVLSALFSHKGREYEAYYFDGHDDEKGNYFDEEGNSLRRAFLKAPIKYTRISSRFSPRRLHPVQKVWKAHLGTDFAAPTGTPIVATGDGIVIASAYAGGNGNYVKIQHDNVYATQYLHMSKRAVKRGDRVKQGDVIGYVGSTGLATGPHVCYRFWKNGVQVDALAQEFPSAEPIADQYKAAFNRVIHQHREILASLDPNKPSSLQPGFMLERSQFNMDRLLASKEGEDTHSMEFGPRRM